MVQFGNKMNFFIIGGYLDNLQITNQCEAFDCINKRIIKLPNLSNSLGFTIVNIFNDTVTVTGGIIQNMSINQQIEFLLKNCWVSCTITSQLSSMALMMCSIQIEQNQQIYWGDTQKIIKDQNNALFQRQMIRQQKSLKLNSWNNIPIIHQGRIWALQNVVLDNQSNCSHDFRRILIFDGIFWKYNDLK